MIRHTLQPDQLALPKAPYSSVLVNGGLVYTAGQIAFNADGELVGDNIETQTRQVFENLRHCLAEAGCGFENVLKVNAFLSDLEDFTVFNTIYAEYFSEPYPVRTTVQAGLMPGFLVEIEVIAQGDAS